MGVCSWMRNVGDVSDAASKGVKIGAAAPCLRLSPVGQMQDQEQAGHTDGHVTRSVSSKQVCFWFDVARCPDPKSVSHTRKSSKGSSVEISKLRRCQRAVGWE